VERWCGDDIMVTEAEKLEETRARQCIEEAKARHWSSVEQFSSARLYVDDDYRWIILRAETVIGDQSKKLEARRRRHSCLSF
jgi:hypothetical protein